MVLKEIFLKYSIMGTIPQEIIQKIKDYTPRDKDMKSPTAYHIKSLLYYYNFDDYERVYNLIDEWDEQHGLDDINPRDEYYLEFDYKPYPNETFYKYTQRIYKKETRRRRRNRILFTRYIPNNNYTDTDSDSDSD